MKTLALLALAIPGCLAASAALAQCPKLSVAEAEGVLGPGVTDITSADDAEFQCFFLGGEPQGSLIIQFGDRGYYQQVSILQPHAPVDVGDEGRSNVDTNGVTAVQFVKGNSSVTMTARSTAPSGGNYLDPLVEAARLIAERL